MFIINFARFVSRNRQILLVLATGTLFFLFSFDAIFSLMFPLEGESESSLHDRLKREISEPDPLKEKDYVDGTLFTEAEVYRFSRRILNESASFIEENGSKRPIPLKKLNQAYADAKKMFFAKKNCVPRPPPTTPPPGAAPAEGDAAAEGGDAPPAEGARRRRGALEMTTERVYYCDEFTTTTIPAPTAAPGGDGGDAPAEAPPAE